MVYDGFIIMLLRTVCMVAVGFVMIISTCKYWHCSLYVPCYVFIIMLLRTVCILDVGFMMIISTCKYFDLYVRCDVYDVIIMLLRVYTGYWFRDDYIDMYGL